jgi:hypothetical protein
MTLPKITDLKSVTAVREAVARVSERRGIPRRLNKVVPRDGTSHPGVTRVCKKIWSYHDKLFPRACEFCVHFDFKLGQDSLAGRSVESEEEAANLTAQRHLLRDYTWDVDGREVTMEPDDLGGCTVHEAYVARNSACEHFERTRGGALVPLEQRVETEPEQVTGWKRAVDPEQDEVEAPEPVAYPEGEVSESKGS